MATVTRAIAVAAALAGCDDLHGLEVVPPTPLVILHVRVTGDINEVRPSGGSPARLRVALLWGTTWLPDPSCMPPYENQDHADVAALGCGDPLAFHGFAFQLSAEAALEPDGTAELDIYDLPDPLIGDIYSQIAYGSVLVYDDTNSNDAFDTFVDVGYGASFSSMTRPDTRIAFRHGAFDEHSAYYPRRGCAPPDEGYSLVSAGGFTLEQAVDAQARGELPLQDPATCHRDPIDREVVVELRPAAEVADVGCPVFAYTYSPAPPFLFPGRDHAVTACTSVPDHGTGQGRGRYQVLITDNSLRTCKHVQHYLLRGCFEDPFCGDPEWEEPAPDWWPCPPEGAP